MRSSRPGVHVDRDDEAASSIASAIAVTFPPGAAPTSSTRSPGCASTAATTAWLPWSCGVARPSRTAGHPARVAGAAHDQRVGQQRGRVRRSRRPPPARRRPRRPSRGGGSPAASARPARWRSPARPRASSTPEVGEEPGHDPVGHRRADRRRASTESPSGHGHGGPSAATLRSTALAYPFARGATARARRPSRRPRRAAPRPRPAGTTPRRSAARTGGIEVVEIAVEHRLEQARRANGAGAACRRPAPSSGPARAAPCRSSRSSAGSSTLANAPLARTRTSDVERDLARRR